MSLSNSDIPEETSVQRNDSDKRLDYSVNDPSAGSPTETLLRLLLPLDDKV